MKSRLRGIFALNFRDKIRPKERDALTVIVENKKEAERLRELAQAKLNGDEVPAP